MLQTNLFKLLIISCTLYALCSACQTQPTIQLPNNIQELSESMAENVLSSMQNQDYDAFIQDFDENMKNAMHQKAFEQMHASFKDKLGAYQDFSFQKVEIEQGFIVAYFIAQFAKGDVTLRLVLEPQEPYKISGMWFPDFPAN